MNRTQIGAIVFFGLLVAAGMLWLAWDLTHPTLYGTYQP